MVSASLPRVRLLAAETGRETAITALRTDRERASKELAAQRSTFEARIADLKENAYKLAEAEVKMCVCRCAVPAGSLCVWEGGRIACPQPQPFLPPCHVAKAHLPLGCQVGGALAAWSGTR